MISNNINGIVEEKRDKKIKEAKSYPDFWLRVLSNHSVTKDFIN